MWAKFRGVLPTSSDNDDSSLYMEIPLRKFFTFTVTDKLQEINKAISNV